MNSSRNHLSRSLGVAVGLVLGVLGPTVASAHNPNPTVFPIGATPYGRTYSQWSARWWQYAVHQTTLNICAPDRPQSLMTFLAGTPGPPVTTSCAVPTGQAIMFPLLNAEWSVAEAQLQQQTTPGQSCLLPGQPDGTSDAALQACATAIADHATCPGASLAASGRLVIAKFDKLSGSLPTLRPYSCGRKPTDLPSRTDPCGSRWILDHPKASESRHTHDPF